LTKDGKLKFLFDPGTSFSYSGEGIGLLQMVIEEITGKGLEELSKERIFKPFGMDHTSYVWQERFEENHAFPHDQYERPQQAQRRREASAIGSMVTTAGDYTRFLVGLLNSRGERRKLVSNMFEPQIAIISTSKFGPGAWEETDQYTNIRLSRTLGWGYFESDFGRAVFHTGHDLGNQNYHVVFLDKGIGAVLLSNSDNFESVARELFRTIIGDTISPFDWLGYPYFEPDKDRTPPPEPVAIELELKVLDKFVGEYTFPGNRILTIKFDGQNLIVSNDGEKWLPLSAESQNKFFVKGRDYKFQFEIDETGRVTGYKLLIEEIEIPGRKIE
jgi:CubicO group peptidase (beta-lactamase class C family)